MPYKLFWSCRSGAALIKTHAYVIYYGEDNHNDATVDTREVPYMTILF